MVLINSIQILQKCLRKFKILLKLVQKEPENINPKKILVYLYFLTKICIPNKLQLNF